MMPNALRSLLGGTKPGWQTVLGAALIVCAGALYFGALLPEQARLEQLQRESAQLRARSNSVDDRAPKAPAEKLAAFYAFFPTRDRLPDLLEKLFAAANRQALVLEHGEYKPVVDEVDALVRYQVVLPVRGSYPQIRKFVDGALAEVPSLSLEGVQFERQKVGDPSVQAKVKFVVYVGKRS